MVARRVQKQPYALHPHLCVSPPPLCCLCVRRVLCFSDSLIPCWEGEPDSEDTAGNSPWTVVLSQTNTGGTEEEEKRRGEREGEMGQAMNGGVGGE